MKTLNIILAVFFLGFSLSTFANDEGKKGQKLSMNYTVQTYIEAMTEGRLVDLPEVLDNNVKFTINQGSKINSFTREQMLKNLKVSENLQQNCKTDFSVVEQSESNCIVKVVMSYDLFTKVNYVTINQIDGAWKITNVTTNFSK